MFYNKQNYECPFFLIAVDIWICTHSNVYKKDGRLLKWLSEWRTHFMENAIFQQLSVSKESQMCCLFIHYYYLETD